MIVALRKSDNRVIESQSHADAATMRLNALSAGLTEDEVEIREVSQQELSSMLETQAAADKIAFEKTSDGVKALLSASDGTMIRVIDDIWTVLKNKGLVADDDLPVAAKEKLAARAELRKKL